VTNPGAFTLGAGATVGAHITAMPDLPTIPPATVFSNGITNQSVGNGATMNLAPGSYNNITLGGAATLNLTTGTYFLNKLTAGNGLDLSINLTTGDHMLRLFVTDDVSIGGISNFVLTGGNEANVLALKGVPVHRTSRGGDVTYHGPGQLVVYPIIDLRSKLRKDVHRYVRNLEQSAIATLADFAIAAARRPPYTGIWIGDKKVGAIGIAVRRCVSYHGLALNVNTDLSYFQRIVPCGLAWADVTSMEKELGAAPSMREVREKFLHHFAELFGYTDIKVAEDGGWVMADRDPQSSILDLRPTI
jgi:lipoate-protein ligase B